MKKYSGGSYSRINPLIYADIDAAGTECAFLDDVNAAQKCLVFGLRPMGAR